MRTRAHVNKLALVTLTLDNVNKLRERCKISISEGVKCFKGLIVEIPSVQYLLVMRTIRTLAHSVGFNANNFRNERALKFNREKRCAKSTSKWAGHRAKPRI